jgi:hypothetical protein
LAVPVDPRRPGRNLMLKILQNCTIHSELRFKYLLYQFESRSVHSVIALDYQLAEAIKEAADARVRIDCVFCLHLGLRGTGPIHCPNVSDLQPMRRCWGTVAVAERQSGSGCCDLPMQRHYSGESRSNAIESSACPTIKCTLDIACR